MTLQKCHSSFDTRRVRGQISEVTADPIMSMKPKPHRRSHTVGHAAVVTHRRHDPSDIILDKIDLELYKLSKVKIR